MSRASKWFLGSGEQAEKEASPESAATGSHAGPDLTTDDSFGEVFLNAAKPVWVDFWAPWCGPWRMIAPIDEDLAEEYEGRAVIYRVNTDENVRVVNHLGIRGIPTRILFKEGQEVDRVVGFAPRDVIRQKPNPVLDSKHDGRRPEAPGGV
jgi:thioredoxin 1